MSDVLKKMAVSRITVSAVCSEALGPYYKEFMLRKMQKASVFTLGLDSSTEELGGLDKHLDIKIHFFDEESKRVQDTYYDSISIWKEPANVQFAALVKTLEAGNLNIANLCSVLCDNPNINKKLVAMVDQYMKDHQYSKLLDVGKCALHPTHTSFRKALDELDIDVWSFAVDLHGYFKISTARQEDLLEIFSIFEDETDLFFL